MISTILIFTQHLLKFKEKTNIENTMNKIKSILKFESSGLMLKSFSLSLWINIIQKISEKNSNIEIGKYIEMINTIIHQIVEEYHKPQQRGFSMQMFINPNYDDIRPDFDVKDVSFDIVVKVDGDEVTAEVDLNPRNINIEGDITDWFAKRFSKMLDIEAIENDVETIAERDVYEIKSVLSNI
jgi:hypothetical protein